MKWIKLLYFVSPVLAKAASPVNDSTPTNPIITQKITPSYWRATFANPPFNIEDNNFFKALYYLVDDISNNTSVKVVVFDSSAPDFFIAHLDLLHTVEDDYINGLWGNLTRLADLPVLTIAAVRGVCRGGGAEIASALDIRFASEKAVFGQLEVGLGSIPGGGGSSLLPRLVGRSRALEIILGAQDMDAGTAEKYGWINRAVPDDKFEEFVDSFARRVSEFDKDAIGEAKRIVNKRAGYPSIKDQAEDWTAALTLLEKPSVQARVAQLIEWGLQQDINFEVHAADELMRLYRQH